MTSNYVDNVMVYADPFHNYCVALVVPSRHILEKWAKEAGMTYGDFPELCDKVEAVKEVQQSLLKVCRFVHLTILCWSTRKFGILNIIGNCQRQSTTLMFFVILDQKMLSRRCAG